MYIICQCTVILRSTSYSFNTLFRHKIHRHARLLFLYSFTAPSCCWENVERKLKILSLQNNITAIWMTLFGFESLKKRSLLHADRVWCRYFFLCCDDANTFQLTHSTVWRAMITIFRCLAIQNDDTHNSFIKEKIWKSLF